MQAIATTAISDIDVQWNLTCTRISEWLKNDVFSFRWWFLLILFMLSTFVWWKAIDKSRLQEILLYTAFISIIALTLDQLGEELALWDYPTDIFPLFPPISAINLASLPMVYSLIYQYFKTWKSFIFANTIMAVIFCFTIEPLFVLGGIYQILIWRYYYGFLIYIAIGISTKVTVMKLYKISHKQGIYNQAKRTVGGNP